MGGYAQEGKIMLSDADVSVTRTGALVRETGFPDFKVLYFDGVFIPFTFLAVFFR